MRWEVRRYETVDSTNLEAKRLLDGGAKPGLVVTARHQTGGRGRMGRAWLDLPGKSLLVSVVLADLSGVESAALAALSIRAAIASSGGRGPLLKWPNDLVYGDRKVGGILSEAYSAGGLEYVVTGLGLNVGYLPGELDIPAKLRATSLLIEEGRTWDREELLAGMLQECGERLGRPRGAWLEEYREHLAYVGERVRVSPPYSFLDGAERGEAFVDGVLRGIDDEGNLLLEVGGEVLRLVSGDVQVVTEG